MDRLQFHPDPGDDVNTGEATIDGAGMAALTKARKRLLALAASCGLGPLAVAALDAELIAMACLVTALESDAFTTGLRLGAVLVGLQVPGLN